MAPFASISIDKLSRLVGTPLSPVLIDVRDAEARAAEPHIVLLGSFRANFPLFSADALQGTIASITSGHIFRDEDGRLNLQVGYRSPIQSLMGLIQAAGLDQYRFTSMDQFLSDDETKPSIFQNLTSGSAQ